MQYPVDSVLQKSGHQNQYVVRLSAFFKDIWNELFSAGPLS